MRVGLNYQYGEQTRRHLNAEFLRGLKIYRELEFGQLRDWNLSRLLPLEDSASIDADLTEHFCDVRSIAETVMSE